MIQKRYLHTFERSMVTFKWRYFSPEPQPEVSVLRKSCCYFAMASEHLPKSANYIAESPLSMQRIGLYSMNKTGGRRKIFITRAIANAARWLSSCTAPSQSPSQAPSLG
jgi:hypothetical protein